MTESDQQHVTIAEFLKARLDDDSVVAFHLDDHRWERDIAVKRRIVDRAWTAIQYRLAMPLPSTVEADAAAIDGFWILDELASAYADHPAYDQKWRP